MPGKKLITYKGTRLSVDSRQKPYVLEKSRMTFMC